YNQASQPPRAGSPPTSSMFLPNLRSIVCHVLWRAALTPMRGILALVAVVLAPTRAIFAVVADRVGQWIMRRVLPW
ncbi:MAG: hypothetical protein ACREI7_11465, partial [Myxococcota bacterium]